MNSSLSVFPLALAIFSCLPVKVHRNKLKMKKSHCDTVHFLYMKPHSFNPSSSGFKDFFTHIPYWSDRNPPWGPSPSGWKLTEQQGIFSLLIETEAFPLLMCAVNTDIYLQHGPLTGPWFLWNRQWRIQLLVLEFLAFVMNNQSY